MKVRLGTLRRRLWHASIIGDINWIPIEVGQGERYTADKRIRNFLQQTALPPAGVLQSSSSVGSPAARRSPRAERHPGRRWRQSHNSAARSGCGRDWRGRCGLRCTAAAAMQRIRGRPPQQWQSLRFARTPVAAAAAAAAAETAVAVAVAVAAAVAAAGAAVGGGTRCNLSSPAGGGGVAVPAAVAAEAAAAAMRRLRLRAAGVRRHSLCDAAPSFAAAGCLSRYASPCWPPSGHRH